MITDEFRHAFASGGCSHAVCHCGRSNGNNPDAPERLDHADEGGGCIVLNLGAGIVEGCDCKLDERYEAFVWENRQAIARYLADRGRKVVADAQQTAADAQASLDSLVELGRVG